MALVPEAVSRSRAAGSRSSSSAAPATPRRFRTTPIEEAGATLVDDGLGRGRRSSRCGSRRDDEAQRLRERPGADRVPRAADRSRRDRPRSAQRGVQAFAMESIPRITRAQSMDALSSQATVAGYKAVLLAAEHLPRFFPMLMTAAGTVAPGEGARARRRRRRTAGDRDRAPPRRGRRRLRRASGREGAGREPRRDLPRPRRRPARRPRAATRAS